MKVTKIKATPLLVPFKEAVETSAGTYQAKSSVLVEVLTDEGLVGLGEAPGIPSADVAVLIIKELADCLVGKDPLAINAFRECALSSRPKTGAMTWGHFPNVAHNALAGIEIALWDIFGKATNQPVHRLLGGSLRDRVDMFAWIRRKEQTAMLADALEFKRNGFRVFYLKVGLGSARDHSDLMALRKAVGAGALIRVDANGAWTPSQAIREIRAWEDINIDWVEQPVAESDFEGFERVARAVSVPLCIDQGALTGALAFEAIRRRLADVVCSDIHRMGGITAFREMAAMANLANMKICRHAGAEFGISATAHLHVMSTIGNATLGNQTYATTITDDIVNEPTSNFCEGSLVVPDLPGLGVTLNSDKVAECAEMYRAVRA